MSKVAKETLTLPDRKPVYEMIGEGLREVGMLVLVFALLDKLVSGQITLWWTATALLLGTLMPLPQVAISKGRDRMGDYSSLALGAVWLAIVFAGTVAHMEYKRRKTGRMEKYPLNRTAEGGMKPQGLLEHR